MTEQLTSNAVAHVGDDHVTVEQLEARLDAIYRGPFALHLPARESQEGQKVRRWVVQLLISEALVVAEARWHGVDVPPYPEAVPPDAPVSANGADAETLHAVEHAFAELFARVTAAVNVLEEDVRRYYDANPDLFTGDRCARTGAIATEFVQRSPGITAPYAEVRDAIHADLLAAARGQAFDEWLLRRRAEVTIVTHGYEHPGDPTMPDFVHRH